MCSKSSNPFVCCLWHHVCVDFVMQSCFYSLPQQILRSLNKTYQVMKKKPMWVDLNPKAVTPNELFGFINPATREWKDGMQLHTHSIP